MSSINAGGIGSSFVGMFPIPVTISFESLDLPTGSHKIFKSVAEGIQGTPRHDWYKGDVHPALAFRVAQKLGFGALKGENNHEIWDIIHKRFFDNVDFSGDHPLKPIKVILRDPKPFADGDTAKVSRFIQAKGEDIILQKAIGVRNDGIDTPESNPSSKLTRVVNGIAGYLSDKFHVYGYGKDVISELVKARTIYLGKLAGAFSLGFAAAFPDSIFLAPAYALAAVGKPLLCNKLDMWDKYGRLIARVMASDDLDEPDKLGEFIKKDLPTIMEDARADYYKPYMEQIKKHETLLDKWRSNARTAGLANMLGAKNVTDPVEAFSASAVQYMSGKWANFVGEHSGAANDMQSMLVFLGLAYTYTKYRGAKTDIDAAAEEIAIKEGFGPASDPFYHLMRPTLKDDKSVFADEKYGPMISGLKLDEMSRLDPPDCRGKDCAVKSK